MLRRDEFGTEESESTLVPESLRAYRHFLLFEDQLWPMTADFNYPSPYRSQVPVYVHDEMGYGYGGCPCGFCIPVDYYTGDSPEISLPPFPPGGSATVFQAKCNRYSAQSMGAMAVITPYPSHAHQAPQEDCTCGFYAHYGPDGDFYAGSKWDAFRGEEHYIRRTTPSQPVPTTQVNGKNLAFALVRTVVELTGKVVLGTEGVRAEKMRIVAASLDWDKFQSAQEVRNSWDVSDPLDSTFFTTHSPMWGYADPETCDRGHNTLRAVARAYGFQAFTDTRDMHRKYPQQDISHLIPKEGAE